MFPFERSVFAVLASLLLSPVGVQAAIVSTFDTGAEGWAVFGDAQGASNEPTWVADGGVTLAVISRRKTTSRVVSGTGTHRPPSWATKPALSARC